MSGPRPEPAPPPAVRFDDQGLVPVIVQDETTGELLMLAWADAAALEATARTGRATFWSRSRRAPWTKGETSGHFLDVSAIRLDCDGDAVLYRARPTGPACHTGEPSCFHLERAAGGDWVPLATGAASDDTPALATLPLALERVIDERRGRDDERSYTALLWRRGQEYVAGKVTEEAAEVADAARTRLPGDLAEEAADLLFHLQVLLRMKGVSWRDVLSVLRARRAGHGRGAKD